MRVARVELAVMVGVEHITQGLHIIGGGRVPLGEHHLILLGDLTGIADVEHQNAIARARPSGMVLIAVPRHIKEHARLRLLRDLYAVSGQVEDDGFALRAIIAGIVCCILMVVLSMICLGLCGIAAAIVVGVGLRSMELIGIRLL